MNRDAWKAGDIRPCPMVMPHQDCTAEGCKETAAKALRHVGCPFCAGARRVRVVEATETRLVLEPSALR